jgi:hypothetical protein
VSASPATLRADESVIPRRVERVKGGSYVYDKDLGCLVPKYGRNYFEHEDKRSDLPSPAIRPDSMPAIQNQVDAKFYDSKSAYYKSVSRAGCEIVGFDKRWEEHVKPPQPYGGDKAHEADLVADVKKATEIEQSKVPSYGPESRRLMRKQRRRERASK